MKAVKPFEAGQLPFALLSALRILLLRRPGLSDLSHMPQIERRANGVQLNPEWLRQYAACIGTSLADTQIHGLPPLTLQMAAGALHLSIIADRAFPFKALGLVHLSQTVVQHRKVSPSMRLNLRAFTTDARAERRGISFGLVTEVYEGDQLVWRSELRALSIVRPRDTTRRPPSQAQDEFADFERIATQRIAVPESMGRYFARIAGDRNPIHQHAWLARLFGFRRAIVHGTWTLARSLVSVGLPGAESFRLHARFQSPVELPSQIVLHLYRGAEAGQQLLRVASADCRSTHVAVEVSAT